MLLDRLRAVADRRGDAMAMSNEQSTLDFQALLRAVEAWREFLSPRPSARLVVVALPGGPGFGVVQLAALAAGATMVPVPSDATASEARMYLRRLRPDVLFVATLEGGRAWLEALTNPATVVEMGALGEARLPPQACVHEGLGGGGAPPEGRRIAARDLPPNTAILQYTSGSSGSPKGILIHDDAIHAYLRSQEDFLQRHGDQQLFCPAPQAHSYGGTVVLEHLLHGTGVHVANRFRPASDFQRMQQQSCQGLAAPPTYLRLLLQLGALKKEALPELRWINLGTAAPDPDLIDDLRTLRPDLTLILRYGMTESFGYIAREVLPPGRELDSEGLVGATIAGVELAPGLPSQRNAEPAEIRVRGATIARTHLQEDGRVETLVEPDGWLATGDLATLDSQGRLCLRGRRSAFLKRNGYRIDPFEIEALLRAQPGVAEVVVVGLPDRLAGQRILAAVEAALDAEPPEPKKLLERCRERLSSPKIPQECRVLERLPRTRSGKPDRPAVIKALQSPPPNP